MSTATQLTPAVEKYFKRLGRIRATGGGTGERSNYGPLENLLNAVGETLKPKVFCVGELADQGEGHPDFGLYTANQVQKRNPRPGQIPERGVVEVKSTAENMGTPEVRGQVTRYWTRYDLVLMTNFRGFTLVGRDGVGNETDIESYSLAATEEEFNRRLQKPRAFAREVGAGLSEFLIRALSHQAAITEPKDLAWLLASYARDGLARVEAAGDTPSLDSIRSALEESLGVQFEDERGKRFFHSTLVQTLFYGIFSAWVLWSREARNKMEKFDWRTSHWTLRTPIMSALFGQLAQPVRLKPLGLVEILDVASSALNRVEPDAFFARFDQGEAVTYFYEPFLEAFDPDLRKQLGVWYTPSEVVRYMVARVDKALKEDLGITDGLAAENVYVLDPCCGTGAYLAEVLRRIATNLEDRGVGALSGSWVNAAATKRVFGFEIMPAPYAVAHMQVALTLHDLDVSIPDDSTERIGIFLTNALTGWEPKSHKPLPFHGLEQERRDAGRVKTDTPILVIVGNPPYNGFAHMAVDEERVLSDAYRTTKHVRRPEGKGLNDLYVRFFRMAERRIAKTGRGVVCFISNYSWLDGLSFTGMREQFLEVFDEIRIDCLNGDKYKTGKVAPDGSPDPSIFSTESDPVGIQVGTAITTVIRRTDHISPNTVGFRHLWGSDKPKVLIETAETEPQTLYADIEPNPSLGLPFFPTQVSEDWLDWPALSDLFPRSFPGVKSGRDSFVVDIDLDQLKARIVDYFDESKSHDEIYSHYKSAMRNPKEYDARTVRDTLLRHGGPADSRFTAYAFRPFDNRWIYWESRAKLVDRPRLEYKPHIFPANVWMVLQNKARPDLSPPLVISHLGDLNQMNSGVYCIPIWLSNHELEIETGELPYRPNLSRGAQSYLDELGASIEDLFYHVLAVLHRPTYTEMNADALRAEGPRVPLPGWPDGKADGAAQALAESAARGRDLAGLLDPDTPVPGVTEGALRPEFRAIAKPSTVDNRYMSGDDFAVIAGWGHYGSGEAVMPGQGRAEQRKYTADENQALGSTKSVLGDTTYDIYLNDKSFWHNVPAAVWNYKLGGYQVLKKWLSYREQKVLDRALKPEEVQYFAEVARRIAGILILTGEGEG